jgi:hypothetical protein
MDDYISVKQFASRAGVTVQAVYQRIDKDLKPFLKVIKGKKFLDIKGLELFVIKEIEQVIEQDLLKSFKETLKLLTAQLEVKDKQIADLNERLREAQELNRNNQILLGGEQARHLLTDGEEIKQKRLFGIFRKK